MEGLNSNSIDSCDNFDLFYKKFWEKRDLIFEKIYDILEKDSTSEDEEIKIILKDKTISKEDKIDKIKNKTLDKYFKNYEKNYKPIILKDDKLGLIISKFLKSIKLIYYNNNKDVNKDCPVLLNIDFLRKIKIMDEEEWICNAQYAFYLLNNIKKLINPHPVNTDYNKDDNSDSSYSLNDFYDIEHLVFITNNKKIIELDADLNDSFYSGIYKGIEEKYEITDGDIKYIGESLPGLNIKEVEKQNSEVINASFQYFFRNIKRDSKNKNKVIVFQDDNIQSNFEKITSLNELFLTNQIRFFYLDLNILKNIKKTIEKKQYLAYYIARIYQSDKLNKEEYESFMKDVLINIRYENFIEELIEKIINKNNSLVQENKTTIPLFIMIDNIDSENNYLILNKLMDKKFDNDVRLYGIINIDSEFGKDKFSSLYNTTFKERGYHVYYLYSKNKENNNLIDNLNNFFKNNNKNNIIALREMIQLLYFEEFINKYPEIGCNFLMKYLKYIKLILIKGKSYDTNLPLKISNIEFKTKEIKEKFIYNYNDIIISFINNNDKNINGLFSDVQGNFFEKQIILDILLDRIRENENFNFKELKVKTIYCMNLYLNNEINYDEYKGKNIILLQGSRTGEIYDFGIIIGKFIKLFQVSINKSLEDLLRLNREVIEVDCEHMTNTGLNNIDNYKNVSFGIITSKTAFDKYKELKEKYKIKNNNKILNSIEKTSYFLMKQHCNNNNYEFLVYDILNNKFYIENNSNELVEYNNFYVFDEKSKLNINKLSNIFSFESKKISTKYFDKNNFISDLNKIQLFEDIKDKNSLNIIGKFKYNKNFLDIKEITQENYCLCISNINKEKKNLNIIKYKNETFENEINCEKSKTNVKNPESKNNRKSPEIILFSFDKTIKFIGNKRKRSISEEINIKK